MKKKATKKKTATPKPDIQTTVLGKEHDLSRFADDESCRYALDQFKYDASRKCLVATDGTICAVVALDAGQHDMLIDAKAVREAMCEARSGSPVCLKQTGDTVTIESQDGRTVRQVGEQDGKWPSSWPDCYTVDVSQAIVFAVAPKLLKAIAEYAIACDKDSVEIAVSPNEYGAVDSGLVWLVGNTVGVLMPLGRDEEPSKLSKGIRAAIQVPMKAMKMGKVAREEKT